MITKRFGLIGRTLGHSFSARYFTEKFEALHLPCRYDLFEFETVGEIRLQLSQMTELSGLNVTIPYKEAIIPFLDSLDETAAAIGAVNTIRIREGHWRGYNTDAEGFLSTLTAAFGNQFPEQAIILGNGGASRAVQFVLHSAGIHYRIFVRNPKLGQYFLESVTETQMREAHLIVQTTPVGMFPDTEAAVQFPFHKLGKEHTLIDLVYNPELTKCMRIAASNGARCINGLQMLYGQAEAAWQIWNT